MPDDTPQPVTGADEDRWATRHGTFAPGVGADGRAPRGPRTERETPAEFFARTRDIPGGDLVDRQSFADQMLVNTAGFVAFGFALEAILGGQRMINGAVLMYCGVAATLLIHTGLKARPGVPAWARWVAVVAVIGVIVGAMVLSLGRPE